MVAQRSETIKQLTLSYGERVLDVGCGPGFLCESMADPVGRDGAVIGIDISRDFVALCKRRGPPKCLSYEVGDATQLAQPDASFDVVVCTQVAEYMPDVNRALSEAFPVVKRGGRAMFVATDWDSVVWHSETPDRMALVLKSWEAHCAHPHLPRSLTHRLVSAGFRSMVRLSFQSSISNGMMTLTAKVWQDSSGISLGALPSEDLNEWYDEFTRLSEAGRYFFSSNRYIFRASKPGR